MPFDNSVPPQFVVFNYVTNRIEQVEEPPQFGDPNQALQAEAMAAYGGSSAGGVSLSSAVMEGPTAATLGNPAAAAIAAAASLPAELASSVTAAFGSIGAIGGVPAMISNMSSHATNVLGNAAKVFDAIDTVFSPELAGSPLRCASLGDFIGSIQGRFNDAIGGVTKGLGQIANSLLSVPLSIIGGFVSVTNQLISAITGGITSAINLAIGAVTGVVNSVLGAVGSVAKGIFDAVGSAVNQVSSAISAEIANVTSALSRMASNAFRLVVPNVSPCVKEIFGKSNPASQNFVNPPCSLPPESDTLVRNRRFLQESQRRARAAGFLT